MKTNRQWMLLAVVFLVGIALGAGITWTIEIFSGPQFDIVEGYTTNVDLDGEAIGLALEPGGQGVGYQIAGAWWREKDGPWHTHGPTCLEPLTNGQKVRLGVVHLETSEAPRADAVVWLECVGRATSSESTPETTQPYGEAQSLVDLAQADLERRLGVGIDEIAVQSVEATEFSDTSLGVPVPGKMYAQVITPGYVIELAVEDTVHEYHGAGDRVVLVPDEGETFKGSITIKGVEVTTGEWIIVHGYSTLLDGTCLGTELWADGEPQTWWPGDTCVPVQKGAWQLSVRLGQDSAPAELDATAQYMVRAYQQGGPNIVSVFPFDLAGPPTPKP
jgi:hypothetical protein